MFPFLFNEQIRLIAWATVEVVHANVIQQSHETNTLTNKRGVPVLVI